MTHEYTYASNKKQSFTAKLQGFLVTVQYVRANFCLTRSRCKCSETSNTQIYRIGLNDHSLMTKTFLKRDTLGRDLFFLQRELTVSCATQHYSTRNSCHKLPPASPALYLHEGMQAGTQKA